ncbi:hypothetical protein J5N97_005701 [Dioscorea zingiberensis]|uniref:WW domain-containing protein n=1 Tax=Dioscorea zingiberensis TaxID=325984 RepID=A0A9D5HS51_9LILI|nr:hypothetical protein J5N97_005701 [Dioscorea zingiberensis]
MVSLQAGLNPVQNSLKKRKWEEDGGEEGREAKEQKLWMDEEAKGKDDIELNLETPLPLEWQRCLDIKSGEIHYYNTRTHMRTSIDPRQCTEAVVSLDLELNLAWEPKKSHANDQEENNKNKNKNKQSNSSLLTSWVSMDDEEKEMIAAVCTRCHMLVMMCKASPACPNCKFVHPPPNPSSPSLLKGELSLRLLCCKD